MKPMLVLGLLATLLMAGCDNVFNPVAPGDRYFALYGILDGRSATQQIRVDDLAAALNVPAQLDARLTLRELNSGDVSEGRDSLITLDDGTEGHLFVVPSQIVPGRTYEIEVARLSEPAATSSARVRVPSPWIADTTAAVEQPPDSGQLIQRVVLVDGALPLVGNVTVVYDVQNRSTGNQHRFSFFQLTLTSTDGLSSIVELSDDVEAIRDALGVEPDDDQTLALERVALHYTRASTQTSPVMQGVGELGWIAPFESAWALDAETLSLLGLVDAQSAGPGL